VALALVIGWLLLAGIGLRSDGSGVSTAVCSPDRCPRLNSSLQLPDQFLDQLDAQARGR
jgi:hypothetical protein